MEERQKYVLARMLLQSVLPDVPRIYNDYVDMDLKLEGFRRSQDLASPEGRKLVSDIAHAIKRAYVLIFDVKVRKYPLFTEE